MLKNCFLTFCFIFLASFFSKYVIKILIFHRSISTNSTNKSSLFCFVVLLNITCEWQIIKLILWLETITFCSQCWFLVLTSSKQGWQLQNIATKYSNKTSNHKFNLSYFTIGKRELNYNHRFWQLSGLLKNCL